MRRGPNVRLAVALGSMAMLCAQASCGSTPSATEDAGRSASRAESARDVAALTHGCLASIRRLRESGDARSMPEVLRKCGDVFEERACRDAYHHAADDPRSGLGPVVTACKRAYCPRLASPRPALCGDEEIPAEQRHDAWRELFRAMLDRDVGPRNREQIDASFAALSESPPPQSPNAPAGAGPAPTGDAPSGDEPSDVPPLIVRLTPQNGDIRIELEGPNGEHGSWLMPAGAADEQVRDQIAPTFRGIAPKPVRLRSGPAVQVLDVMVVASALRGLGFHEVRVEGP